jgi:linoleate 8R-lipoxygenase/9,12-octadecadienoate 8-hydroperoxide 8R-isomerase
MAEPTRKNTIRKVIENFLYQLYQVICASLRPLPTQTGDGTYITDPSPSTGILRDIRHVNLKNVEHLIGVMRQAASGEPTNDKEYIMERVIQVCERRRPYEHAVADRWQLASELPITSRKGKVVTNSFLRLLWNDLKHPPLSYVHT